MFGMGPSSKPGQRHWPGFFYLYNGRMTPKAHSSLCPHLLELEAKMLRGTFEIEAWFRSQWRDHQPPFYSSVDLRNACFKLAPVDTNLFPGGFNNLGPSAHPVTIQALMAAGEDHCPEMRRVLLVPENHTRNTFYLRNVAVLQRLLLQAGYQVRIGSLLPEVTEPTPLVLPPAEGHPHEETLLLEPLVRRGSRLGLQDFDPCMVLLNNDLSAGAPAILQGIQGQHLLPPLHGGWFARRKSHHFAAYRDVAAEFSARLGIDPWIIDPIFDTCTGINFHERSGEEEMADKVDRMLAEIRRRYQEHKVEQTPFVVIKADAGTYGMGIMMVKDAAEVRNLNRKQRNKMSVIKEGLEVSDVLLQEGVHSFETVMHDGLESVAEPVVYMVDRYVVGGFYRVHAERGPDENLNAPGAHFVPLPFDDGCHQPMPSGHPDATQNRLYLYGVIARLAALAASRELEATNPALDISMQAA